MRYVFIYKGFLIHQKWVSWDRLKITGVEQGGFGSPTTPSYLVARTMVDSPAYVLNKDGLRTQPATSPPMKANKALCALDMFAD